MFIDSLSVEITRRCNLRCAHCLRGGAQRKDLEVGHFNRLLHMGVDGIGSLVLTGGEPSLRPGIINQIYTSLLQHRMHVNSFYIATNGTHVTDAFIESVRRLNWYMEDKGASAIEVSMDTYHQHAVAKGYGRHGFYELQDALGEELIVAMRNVDQSDGVIGMGRAKTNQISYDTPKDEPVYGIGSEIRGSMCLSVDGWIISGGNWSWNEQKKHRVFHVDHAYDLRDVIPSEGDESELTDW